MFQSAPRLRANGECRGAKQFARKKITALLLGLAFLALVSAVRGRAQAPQAEWAWENGDSVASYGTLGIASRSNTPAGRFFPTTWTDKSGKFWLFGGYLGNINPDLEINDLWKFDPTTAEWTWISGSNSPLAAGVYGQRGVASPTNVPGARQGGAGWTDSSGNLWLFGGLNTDYPDVSYLNDLWKFDPITVEWTWMGGNIAVSDAKSTPPCPTYSYGTLDVVSATNLPPPRAWSATWGDNSGMFWLFGGFGCLDKGGYDPTDLWRYNPSSGVWTWMGGTSNSGPVYGTYGALGVESGSNFPGSRAYAAHWTDADGAFWLFGGNGTDSNSMRGSLNDLWRFKPSTGKWAWISGSDNLGNENCNPGTTVDCGRSGVYGTLGQSGVGNVPSGRVGPVGAALANGKFLVFGGEIDALGTLLNDLWQFDPAGGEWAWIDGSDPFNCGAAGQDPCGSLGEYGVYGTLGIPDATNHPGGRYALAAWADKGSNLWIFGGYGLEVQGPSFELNDTWAYGTSLPAIPTIAIVTATSSANPIFTDNNLTLTAHVTSTTALPNSPTGTVQFGANALVGGSPIVLGIATIDTSGDAKLSLASLPVGTLNITAAYNGDAKNLAATGSFTEVVGDFSLAASAPATATVSSGGAATYGLTLTPTGPITVFPGAIAFAASGGPAGATYVFSPVSIASGSASANATLTVSVPAQAAVATATGVRWRSAPVISFALVALLLPFAQSGDRRRPAKRTMGFMLVGALVCTIAMGGCGNKFYLGIAPQPPQPPQPPNPPSPPAAQTYTITFVGSSGGLNHTTTVTLIAP